MDGFGRQVGLRGNRGTNAALDRLAATAPYLPRQSTTAPQDFIRGRPAGIGPLSTQPWRSTVTLLRSIFVAAAFGLAATLPTTAADISGAGATFPFPIYAKWADAYKKETGIGLNYQSIGSGGGIKQILARTVTFGASDMPLKAADLDKGGLIQFPTVLGGVVAVINVEGIKPGGIILDGPTLSRIFLGEVKTWNDAAIATLNPGLKLPAQSIVVVHRSDGSGTTAIFTNYLSKVSAEWKSKVGSNTAVEWPVGIGAKGNEGVANNVAQTRGSVGYVEYAYAKQNKLTFTSLVNREGKTVAPTAISFQASAANANWTGTPGFGVMLTNEAGATAWPISGATFILIHKQPKDAAAAGEALRFFAWAFAKGGAMAEALDYVPLPMNVVAAIQKVWAVEVKDAGGKPIFALSH
ncbi:MAG: phosphate ABC transporter substrate-binding protein PstS [Proteobacteria bacterium]|nr:phosphate ABC transporter substrate-binding protein PstS [Pseudomonadota bacterium]